VLSARFAKYGLTIHPAKTRLIDFTKPEGGQKKGSGSFSFLGFKHHWTKSTKGNWVIGRRTDGKRLGRALKVIGQWCREHRDTLRRKQHEILTMKLRGHYAYYGITFNFRSIQMFYRRVQRIWFKWLNRRSRLRNYNWERFTEYLRNYPYHKFGTVKFTAVINFDHVNHCNIMSYDFKIRQLCRFLNLAA
jgi:hypothetical protein